MKTIFGLTVSLTATASIAAPIIPTAPGMAWRYNMTQEVSAGLSVPDIKPDPDGKFRTAVVYRLEGIEDVDGKELLKFGDGLAI